MANTKMYQLLNDLMSKSNIGGGLNIFDPNTASFLAGAISDLSTYGFHGTLGSYTPSTPDSTGYRVFRVRCDPKITTFVPKTESSYPFWITASGEIYTDKTEETTIYIEWSDSGSLSGTEKQSGIEHNIGFKKLQVTSTSQQFVLHGWNEYFNLTGWPYFDVEGPEGTNVWVKNFKVEIGKVQYPTFTKAHTVLEKITEAELDELLTKLV